MAAVKWIGGKWIGTGSIGIVAAALGLIACGTGDEPPYMPSASSTTPGVAPGNNSSATSTSSSATSVTSVTSAASITTSNASSTGAEQTQSTSSGSPVVTGSESTSQNSTSGDSDSSSGEPTSEACGTDECPFDGGLTFACGTRFALGVNYAWHDFGADFGGLAEWDLGGITASREAVSAELADMKANGVSVVRWWMFPDFRGDGVQFDAQDNPTGLSPTAIEDIQTALELAAEHDIYLVLTLFSFDNFRPTRDESGINIRGISPLVQDPARRATLVENIVKPAARAAASAPHASRLLGWDVINEPEWAIEPTGENDQDFTPNEECDAVSLADMTALINETLTGLRTETPNALLSVGWAAAKWAWAFGEVTNVDFHQPHIYGWVNMYWPYTQTPAELGYGDKPTVMGEFYMLDMPFADSEDQTPFSTIVDSWYQNGYAGAWPWSYTDMNSGPENLPLIKAFAEEKGCSVAF